MVDVQLDSTKEVMDLSGGHLSAIQSILISPSHHHLLPFHSFSHHSCLTHLTSDGDRIFVFKSSWTAIFVSIVKRQAHNCFSHACLAFFIDEIHQAPSADLHGLLRLSLQGRR